MSEQVLASVCRELYTHGWLVTTFVTGRHGDATSMAMHYAKNYDRIVAMGGDGTLDEVVTGLLKADLDLPVGFIPAGSTNDFASTFGIPREPKEAAVLAATGSIRKIDVAKFNDSYFNFHAACGPLAQVVNDTPQDIKNQFGYLGYILEGARDISTWKPVHATFTANGNTYEGNWIYGGLVSTVSLGGNILSLPKETVKPDDGIFEAVLVKFPNDLIELGETVSELRSGTFNGDKVKFFEFSSCTIDTEEPSEWSLDGERVKDITHVDASVMKQRLSLIGASEEKEE